MKELEKIYNLKKEKLNIWVMNHYLQIGIFNIIVIFLFLLHSAGYFHPFFTISINFIVVISMLVAIPLFSARSRSFFTIALAFWLFASLIKIAGVNVWAERTAVYAYQAIVIGTAILFFEKS